MRSTEHQRPGHRRTPPDPLHPAAESSLISDLLRPFPDLTRPVPLPTQPTSRPAARGRRAAAPEIAPEIAPGMTQGIAAIPVGAATRTPDDDPTPRLDRTAGAFPASPATPAAGSDAESPGGPETSPAAASTDTSATRSTTSPAGPAASEPHSTEPHSTSSTTRTTGSEPAAATRTALHAAPVPSGEQPPALLAVLDAVDVGVVLRDPSGTPLAENAQAQRLLSAGDAGGDLRITSSTVPGPDGRPELVVATLVDTSAGRRRDRELAVSERRFRVVMEHSPVGYALLEPGGTVVEANRALTRMLGRPASELSGRGLWEFSHPDDPNGDAELLSGIRAGSRDSYGIERRYLRPGGETLWARTTLTAVRESDGSILHLVAQLQDITDMRLAEEAMRHQALHDPLTGLPNRTLGLDRIQQALDRTSRTRRRVAVLCCELDRFKVVNDGVGHALGDAILVEVARRLQQMLRATDTAARLGGDEFIVVCEDVQDEREAVLVADRILAAMRQPIGVGGRSVLQTVSIGIAVSSPRADDAVGLLQDAGTALHRAKENGRGSWDVVDDDLRRRAVDRLDIEHALRSGLQNGDLRAYFQPIVNLATGQPVGQEALVRWQHPTRGLLSPAWFLPVAEESGLIEDLGRWVLLEAARTTAGSPGTGYVAVNVSPSQLMRSGLLGDIETVLEQTRLPPSRLVVELTESVMLGAAPAGRKELQRLDELGVRLMVDDFGTGFSALSYLRDLPVSGIKVDRSFTAGLGQDAQCDRIVEALAGLAHGLGVDLVAEGVETERQRTLLTRIGCLHAQGYLFGRPAPHQA